MVGTLVVALAGMHSSASSKKSVWERVLITGIHIEHFSRVYSKGDPHRRGLKGTDAPQPRRRRPARGIPTISGGALRAVDASSATKRLAGIRRGLGSIGSLQSASMRVAPTIDSWAYRI